jgi:hypothetical protein
MQEYNISQIYKVDRVPSDTQMRTILDPVNPNSIKPLFKEIFSYVQRGKVLENYIFMKKYYLLSLDGTTYFSSNEIHCDSCLEKHHKNGRITYSHQILGAVLLHPERKEVIPFAPEAIIKQDGVTKNDCERNASKRFFEDLRREHPHLNLIIIEDGISSNAPHIKDLTAHNLRYILGVKSGDHEYLFSYVNSVEDVITYEILEGETTHKFRFINKVPLNKSNQEILVNFLEYWEVTKIKTQHFSWLTDFEISKDNCYELMKGGRSRWKIENETFNTLKNQGYEFDHNYGHGNNNLSVNFALLMMLAFLIDQIQQICSEIFIKALKKLGFKKYLWEATRELFHTFELESLNQIYEAIYYGFKISKIEILNTS